MASPYDYLERCSSLAVIGGTFDPIHNGHLAIAETVLHHYKLQRVLFIPSGHPPHKSDKKVTDPEHRYQMVLNTVCTYPGFDVTKIEITRKGNSYTYDTIRALRTVLPNHAQLYFVIGADAVFDLEKWYEYKKLLTSCVFIAVARPGYDEKKMMQHVQYLTKTYNAQIEIMPWDAVDISSTEIRSMLKNGQSVRQHIPAGVVDYIHEYALYGSLGTALTDARFEAAKEQLKSYLSAKRFTHTLGVIEESERLAAHYKVDKAKAKWAALLHDCTKEYGTDKKKALCTLWAIPLDETMKKTIDLAHGFLGAESAKRDYYVHDEDILQAIRYHTTGHKDMTMLDKIIMLADYIEPYREPYKPLNEMRQLAYKDINKALIIGTQSTIAAEAMHGNPIHPFSYDAIEALK